MTKEEKLIVSAYTGVLMVNFNELHKFAETQLGRPIFSHEFGSKAVVDELKDAVHYKFIKLCEEET